MDVSVLAQMEDEDAMLIMQMLQEDVEEAIDNSVGKGKQPEGTETDQQIGLKLFLKELKDATQCAADRRMTESIQRAIGADGDILVDSQNEERMAQNDRNLALNQGKTPPPPSVSQSDENLIDDADEDFLAKLSAIYITGIDDIDSDDGIADQPEASAWGSSRQRKPRGEKRNCEACRDPKCFFELAKAPCGHEYCQDCLTHLFQDSMLDESLFPPRCCKQRIPLHRNRLFLDSKVAQEFPKKALEFSTPNRTYCHNQHCASFIPRKQYQDSVAVCEDCEARTCISCKGASHGGDCPNDSQLQEVLQLAREQGWQRCSNCWGMVELHVGCNHMT